jgi:diamine N-acetyltransferase
MNSHSTPYISHSSLRGITLRAIEPEDLDLLYRIENDVRLWNVGTSNVPYSRYLLHDYVAHATNDIYADRQVRMMIDNAEGEAVGIVDLVSFDPANRRAEVGIIILNDRRRQGYGTATLRQVDDYALRILHLHQLYAYIDEFNEASLSLFRKAGYTVAAHVADWLFDGEHYRDALLMQRIL